MYVHSQFSVLFQEVGGLDLSQGIRRQGREKECKGIGETEQGGGIDDGRGQAQEPGQFVQDSLFFLGFLGEKDVQQQSEDEDGHELNDGYEHSQ